MRRLIEFTHKYSTVLNISILIVNFIILCGSVYTTLRISGETRILSGGLAIQRIVLNLGIPPEWPAFRGYLKETLREGRPRNEVLKELDKVGPYVIKSEGSVCEIIEFQLGLAKRTRYPIQLCYQDDEVKSLRDYGILSP